MKEFIKTVDGFPFWLKLILCLPVCDIFWAVYRILKGVATNNAVLIVIGVIWVIFGGWITWIFDLITTIVYKHPKLT